MQKSILIEAVEAAFSVLFIEDVRYTHISAWDVQPVVACNTIVSIRRQVSGNEVWHLKLS